MGKADEWKERIKGECGGECMVGGGARAMLSDD